MQADLEFVQLINELELEIMAEAKQRKPRKTKAQKEAETAQTTKSLIDAMKFLKLGQTKNGLPDSTHCQLKNHWAIVVNESIAMGTPIDEDLDACPHTYNLLNALSSCPANELLISQPNKFELNIKSGQFSADVGCIEGFENEPTCFTIVDQPLIPVEGTPILAAFEALCKLASKSPTNPIFGCVMLQANSAVVTDGSAILEYWHGVNLPPNMLIPRNVVDAVIGCKKELKSIGISNYFLSNGSPSSITFHFDDTSWVKTNLVDLPYVNYSPLLNVPTTQAELPPNFFEGIKALAPLTDDSIVGFDGFGLRLTNGASYEIPGLPEDIAFNSDYLLQFEKFMKTVDFDVPNQHVLFYGDGIRGLLKAVEI